MPSTARTDRTAPSLERRVLTETDVAELTGFTVRTLQDRRHRRLGPPYHKHGRKVVYYAHEVAQWLERQFVGGTDDASRSAR
jgi:hypothetical protein